MIEKRYFEKRWGEEYYIFDSNTISESDFEEKLEYQDYRAFEDSMMGDEVVNRLNELSYENEQLKQFKEKVFALIDKEIARNEKAIEWGKETGADSGSIGFYNHMLNRLKKELKE